MKKCNKCSITKPLTEFFKDKSNKTNGHYSICKKCKTDSAMNWRAANKEQYNSNQRQQHKKNYERNRLYRYGLTPEQYNGMLQIQDNKCCTCSCAPKKTRPLVIDHDHITGEVRGLLCYKCNRDMVVVDDKEHLAKLISYRDKKHSK